MRLAQLVLAGFSDQEQVLLREALKDLTALFSGENHCASDFSELVSVCDAVSSEASQLILLNLDPPGLSDGVNMLRRIKRRTWLKQIPVIGFLSSPREESVRMAYQLGINSVVIKGMQFEDLLQTLREVLTYWTQHVCLP